MKKYLGMIYLRVSACISVTLFLFGVCFVHGENFDFFSYAVDTMTLRSPGRGVWA